MIKAIYKRNHLTVLMDSEAWMTDHMVSKGMVTGTNKSIHIDLQWHKGGSRHWKQQRIF